jgi:hypothetical protein
MKYRVQLLRIAYREAIIEVEAADHHEAKKKGLEDASSAEFKSEHDYEYAVGDVRFIPAWEKQDVA